jgi:hypothetical protein
MINLEFKPVKKVYGTPWSKLSKIELSQESLEMLGDFLIKTLAHESHVDFAKRGWSGNDPTKGPPIWDSFTYVVSGKTLEIQSSFYGIAEMVSGDIPERKMTWLTQEAKDLHPREYKLTKTEKRFRMNPAGKMSKGKRMPLVVPLRQKTGTVIFRMAPLKMADAWVHPGIARFTFIQRAIKKGKIKCAELIGKELLKALIKGDPTK